MENTTILFSHKPQCKLKHLSLAVKLLCQSKQNISALRCLKPIILTKRSLDSQYIKYCLYTYPKLSIDRYKLMRRINKIEVYTVGT